MKRLAFTLLVLAIFVALVGVWVVLFFAIPAQSRADTSTLESFKLPVCDTVIREDGSLKSTCWPGPETWTATKVSTDTETKPAVCEALDGSGDIEPCAWQEAAKAAAERAVQEARDKEACHLKGCRVHRQSCVDLCQHGARVSLYCDPSVTWHCDCDWKPSVEQAIRVEQAIQEARKSACRMKLCCVRENGDSWSCDCDCKWNPKPSQKKAGKP